MESVRSLEDLLDLQTVDLEIDRLLHERQSLPALEEYRASHEVVAGLQRDHDRVDSELRDTSLELDRVSGELELAEHKLASEQNRLYAGGLSARDALFLRQEVEMLGRRKGEMEDRVLELMEGRDRLEEDRDDLAERLAAASGEKARLETSIQAAWRAIDGRIAVKEARKSEIVPLIDEGLLDLYEELRTLKEGVAVGRLSEGVCGGCHLRLTAAEQLEVRASDPPRCLHCRRILAL